MTTEMKNQPQPAADALSGDELNPNAMAAIRGIMEAEPEITPQPVAAREAEKAERASAPEPVSQPAQTPRAKPSPRTEAAPVEPGLIGRLKARVMNYRPTPRHLVWGSLALLVLLRPWLVVGVIFLGIMFILLLFLILGYDGFWTRAMGIGRWYASRRPARAAQIHRKLDNFALKWDAVLDRFPEGTVDGLYLPDFGELATADARHDEALERRFANLREGEA